MKLIATMPARNESWCLAASVVSALRWCDAAVVLNHCSTDGTAGVIDALRAVYGSRVERLDEADPTWAEARIRQRMLVLAREMGATYVATVDADEVLTANKTAAMREAVAQIEPGQVLKVPWFMLWGSLDEYRAGDGSVWASSTAFAAFAVTRSVSYSAGADGYDIHTRTPAGLSPVEVWPGRDGGLMHLQHVSRRRLRAKQVLYKLNERLRWPNRNNAEEINRRYDPTVDEVGMKCAPVPTAEPGEWWLADIRRLVKPEETPWQEREVKRLLEQHGRETFARLNLWGF